MPKIYIFNKFNKQKRIIISACSYNDALDALYELNINAVKEYDLVNNLTNDINPMPYLDIDKEYWELPYFLNEQEYSIVKIMYGKDKYCCKKVIDHSIE